MTGSRLDFIMLCRLSRLLTHSLKVGMLRTSYRWRHDTVKKPYCYFLLQLIICTPGYGIYGIMGWKLQKHKNVTSAASTYKYVSRGYFVQYGRAILSENFRVLVIACGILPEWLRGRITTRNASQIKLRLPINWTPDTKFVREFEPLRCRHYQFLPWKPKSCLRSCR